MVVCTVCNGRIFSTAAAYEQHIKTHKAHTTYNCTICQQKFPTAFARSGHLSKAHLDLLCRQCNRYYLSKDSLQQHYRTDPNHPTCPRCGSGFPDRHALTVHQTSAHPKPVISCEPCGTFYENEDELGQHWKESDQHPSCITCGIGLQDPLRFDQHIISNHPQLYCDVCAIGFQTAELLQEHYRTCDSDVHPTCLRCNEGFKDHLVYNEHTIARHPPTPTLISDDVGSSGSLSPKQSEYQSHPTSPGTFHCTTCAKKFNHVTHLLQHYKDPLAHPTCVGCERNFATHEAFEQHNAAQHVHGDRSGAPSPESEAPTSPSTQQNVFQFDEDLAITDVGQLNTTEPSESYGSPKTDAPEYARSSMRDMEVGLATPRALSAPTPTLADTRSELDEVGDSAPIAMNGGFGLAGASGDSVQIEILESITAQSLTYASRTSTPELLLSPTSYASSSSTPSSQSVFLKGTSVHSLQSRSYTESLRSSQRSIRSPSPGDIFANSPRPSSRPSRTHSRMSSRVSEADDTTTRAVGPTSRTSTNIPRSPASEYSSTSSSHSTKTRRSTASRQSVREIEQNKSEHTGDTTQAEPSPSAEAKAEAPFAGVTPPVKALIWHCRICLKEPYEPTVTVCGHLFCHGCITKELSKNFQCPVCRKMMLLRLKVEDV